MAYQKPMATTTLANNIHNKVLSFFSPSFVLKFSALAGCNQEIGIRCVVLQQPATTAPGLNVTSDCMLESNCEEAPSTRCVLIQCRLSYASLARCELFDGLLLFSNGF